MTKLIVALQLKILFTYCIKSIPLFKQSEHKKKQKAMSLQYDSEFACLHNEKLPVWISSSSGEIL